MFAVLFTQAVEVLQMALSWLAVAVSRLVQVVLCKLSAICNVCYAFHSGRGSTPVGYILAGKASVGLLAVNCQPSVVFLLYFSRWQTGP